MKLLYLFLGLSLFISCHTIDQNSLKDCWWKYGGGFRTGEVIMFDGSNIKGDTIFRKDKPAAIIRYCGDRYFANGLILEIQSIETGELGTYHCKGGNIFNE